MICEIVCDCNLRVGSCSRAGKGDGVEPPLVGNVWAVSNHRLSGAAKGFAGASVAPKGLRQKKVLSRDPRFMEFLRRSRELFSLPIGGIRSGVELRVRVLKKKDFLGMVIRIIVKVQHSGRCFYSRSQVFSSV